MAKNTNTQKMRISIKLLTLIPVFVHGIVSLISNISSIGNISSVNKTATTIADEYMESIVKLGDIQRETQNLHKKALSHIIATDLNTLIQLVDEVRQEQVILDGYLNTYRAYVDADKQATYDQLLSDYENMKSSIFTLFHLLSSFLFILSHFYSFLANITIQITYHFLFCLFILLILWKVIAISFSSLSTIQRVHSISINNH